MSLVFYVIVKKLKKRFYRVATRSAILYGSAIKKQHVQNMGVTEMKMLRWMSDNTLRNMIRNKCIHGKLEVTSIDDKMRENQLTWLRHVQRRQVKHDQKK